jgi:membrane protein implicated in regulation of membrane protease activity
MEIFGIDAWLFWFLAAMALVAAELVVAFTLYFGPVALGALVACLAAALDASVELQVLVFAVASILSLLFVRPVAKRHLTIDDNVKTGSELLVGKRAVVVSDVTFDSGTVKVDGQDWSARVDDEDGVIPAGTRVTVREFRGVQAIVDAD